MVLGLRDSVRGICRGRLGQEMPLQLCRHHALPPPTPPLLQGMPPTNVPAADTERGELTFLSLKINSNWNHLRLDSPAKKFTQKFQ